MDLREKLKYFESDFSSQQIKTVSQQHEDIDRFINGEEVCNPYGKCFRSVVVYPENQKHGKVSLNFLLQLDSDVFRLVGKDETLSKVNIRNAIFIDTETTGLAGGVGTVPFLVGMGSFSEEGFRIEQFFMRDYNEEHAFLHFIKEKLENCEVIVSYNGKGYDLNLLSSRFMLARIENPARDIPHLDLLFAARRLWRRRIADCSLPSVERHIINFNRQEDIPGYLIPGLYFDYLRSRDGKLLKPVFLHNRWDILSLVALAGITGQIYQDPGQSLVHPLDLVSLGKAFEKLSRVDEAARCFREALNYKMESRDKEEALIRLGYSLKRLGRWELAVKLWEYMIESTPHLLTPYEELAKYYEHRARDFKQAAVIVNRALERIRIIEELNGGSNFYEKSSFEYRLDRLKRKLAPDFIAKYL